MFSPVYRIEERSGNVAINPGKVNLLFPVSVQEDFFKENMEMRKYFVSSSSFLLFLIIHCSNFFAVYGGVSLSELTSSDAICDITRYPDFCKSSFPQNKSTNLNDVGRLCIQKSLSKSRALLSSINGYLNNSQKKLSQTTIYVLQDCQFLISLNLDFLSDAAAATQRLNTLDYSQFQEMKTLLSATITNQDTCLDELYSVDSSFSIANELSPFLNDARRLCSISLVILNNGWIPTKQSRMQRHLADMKFISATKNLPFRISRFDSQLFSSRNGRKLLQIGSMSINVTKSVIVNPDGSGNYTTITDAIQAAPNNTQPGEGYFMIYIVAGVYQEYISIASNKKYLLMVGDGINQTIITGDHNVIDGWTTFQSPTFGKLNIFFFFFFLKFINVYNYIHISLQPWWRKGL